MKYLIITAILLIIVVISCNKTDDTPPIIFMNGADTLVNVLNHPYTDEGATATDETDGNITNTIYTENLVDENKVGWYTVTYKVIDEAGNEAAPVTRAVFVYNEAYIYEDDYQLTEIQQYPNPTTCNYDIFTRIDSTVNYRIVFENFACDFGQPLYADVYDSLLLIPFQIISDSLSSLGIQGSGSISDTLMQLDYTLKNDSIMSLWEAEFIRL
ncbi:MAG: DUF5011 domain-containing protein [Bacteroidales bacterium]|nr:DUF5011 domain-containing protein [Bacteroidales bacterium]